MPIQEQTDLLYAGIFSPDRGEREDMPNIGLAEGFTADNVNCQLRWGEIQRAKMKFGDLLETEYSNGTVSVTNGLKTVTKNDASWASATTHLPYWHGRVIKITDSGGVQRTYTIDSVTYGAVNSVITLVENYAGATEAGRSYVIGTAGDKVQTPDTYPLIHYHRLLQSAGGSETEYLLGFTKAHIYLWSVGWSAWVLKFTCTGNCEYWDTTTFNNSSSVEVVIATNWVDKVQVWGATTANLFDNLDTSSGVEVSTGVYLTSAKYVTTFENYLILAYATVGGTVYPFTLYWCTNGDMTDWVSGGSGDAGNATIREGGFITGLAKKPYQSYLIIGKKEQLRGMWLVENANVFENDILVPQGCVAAGSMINDGSDRFYWLADDFTIRRMPGNEIISTPKEKTLIHILPSLVPYIKAAYMKEVNQIFFSIPYGIDATGNNKILWYDIQYNRWGEIDSAIAAFGSFARQAVYTYDTLGYANYDDWGADWGQYDITLNTLGFIQDLGSDYSGYTYDMHATDTDDGNSYESSFVLSTDLLERIMQKRLGVTIREYKRLQEIQLWLKGQPSGEMNIFVRCDNEISWRSAGAASMISDASEFAITLPVDFRARHYQIKIVSSYPMGFLGIIFGFMPDGDR